MKDDSLCYDPSDLRASTWAKILALENDIGGIRDFLIKTFLGIPFRLEKVSEEEFDLFTVC